MKRITIIFIVTNIFVLSGCKNGLLDIQPPSAVSSSTMWTNESLADQGVNGIYNALRQNTIGYYDYSPGDQVGTYPDAYISSDCRYAQNLMTGSATANDATFSTYWKEHYEGVSRANDAIANLPNAPLDGAKKGRLIAESKFLRAFFYYRLNAVFQGVPLYLEPVEIEDAVKGRETAAAIWAAIIADLTDCIETPDLPDRYEAGHANYGRVTKAAAYALRGKVYLWLEEWQKAITDFRSVKECGHALFQGGFRELFKEANEQSEEMIFSLQQMSLSGYGSVWHYAYGTPVMDKSGWILYSPNPDFVESFEYANGKKFNWDEVIPGYTEMTSEQRSVYFLRNGMTESEMTKMEEYGADLSKYEPSGNEQRVLNAYTQRDPRLAATVLTPYAEYNGAAASTTPHTYTLRWPYRGFDDREPFDMRTDNPSYFLYIYRKFVPEGVGELPVKLHGPIDIPYIRYADVLLGLAEALNELGQIDEAIKYVNEIRNRAGVAALNSNEYTQVIDQDDLRKRIQNERRWEFAGENSNFYDELRCKTWKQHVFTKDAGAKTPWGTAIYSYSWGGDHYYTWPIPAVEIERNPNITQNPGWIN